MYHQLSRATGRLIATSNLQSPLFPVAPIALQRVDPPTITYNTKQMSTVDACAAPGKKTLIPGTNTSYSQVPEKIRKAQEAFQKEDGVPIFLKGGVADAALYRITMALCIIGLGGIAHTIYIHAVPKK